MDSYGLGATEQQKASVPVHMLCSSVELWSLCEMSTEVNEYPLSQSLSNPTSKMPPSLIRCAIIPEGRPLASSSQPHRDFSCFDALSHVPVFLYFVTLIKLDADIIGGFVAVGGNETVWLPLNLLPVYWYCFVSFYQCFFLAFSYLFFLPRSLYLQFSLTDVLIFSKLWTGNWPISFYLIDWFYWHCCCK